MPRTLSLLAAALLLAPCASGRSEGAGAEALLQRVRVATAQARTLHGELVCTTLSGGQKETLRATVRVMRPNFAYCRTIGLPGGEQLTVADGSALYVVQEGRKEYRKLPLQPAGENLFLGGAYSPATLFFNLDVALAGGRAALAGAETVEGRQYQVVEITSGQAPQSRRFYVGPGGVVEGVRARFAAAGTERTVECWLKNIRVNEPLSRQQFAYAPPPDFKLSNPAAPETLLLPAGRTAPDFQLPQPGGAQVSLSGVLREKKAVLVTFWHRDCPSCLTSLPQIQKLYEQYRDRGLEVLAVNAGDSQEAVQAYLQEHRLTYPALLGGDRGTYAVGKAYGVRAYPTNYVLDREGRVVFRMIGFNETAIRQALEKLNVK